MPKIDFSKLDDMLNNSLDFCLTEKQYKEIAGSNLPKDTYYLLHRSALSRHLKELGLKIKINEKTISFEKV